MEAKAIINVIANVIIAISTTGFMALLRHDKSPIEHMPFVIKTWIRLSLGLIASGSLLSAIRISNPEVSEVVVNIGLASMFTWALSWHKKRWISNEG